MTSNTAPLLSHTRLQNTGCLYLHGFLSSPASEKAQLMMQFFEQQPSLGEIIAPELPHVPEQAIELAEKTLQELQSRHEHVWIIGSSLGGFFATYLAEKYQLPAVLINPAVRPFELFKNYLGEHQHFHRDEIICVEPEHLDQLQALDCATFSSPNKILLLLQTADETLDYRHSAALYQDCPAWIEAGGNHSFERFIQRMPQILGHICRNF